MPRIRFCLLAFVLLTAIAAAPGLANAETQVAVDPSGNWKWDATFNDNKMDFSLKLKLEGDKVTGKYTAFDQTTDITEGKLEKDQLSFNAPREFDGNKFDVHFTGKVEPADINGKITLDFGQGPQEFDWHAKRSLEFEDVLGVWELRLETPNGVIEPHITITKDDKGLHGAYVSPFGERDAKNVELKDGQLSWNISGERDGNTFKVEYRGKPQGDSIKGTLDFDFGGNTGTGDFTGKRKPLEEKKAAEAKPAAAQPSATTPAQPDQK